MIDFNLNNKIYVKLKEKGLLHHQDKYNQYLPDKWKRDLQYFKDLQDKDGYTEFTAWEFFKWFGETFTMGFDVPIYTTIKIKEIDLCHV